MRESKVDQRDPAVAIDDDVGWLEVAMHDAVFVDAGDDAGQPHRDARGDARIAALEQTAFVGWAASTGSRVSQDGGNRTRAAIPRRRTALAQRPNHSCEVDALEQLHHVVGHAVGFTDVENRHDPRYLQASDCLDLPVESLARAFEEQLIGTDRLERHAPAERGSFSDVDRSHAAATEELDQAIVAEPFGEVAVVRHRVEQPQAAQRRDPTSQYAGQIGVGLAQTFQRRVPVGQDGLETSLEQGALVIRSRHEAKSSGAASRLAATSLIGGRCPA